MKTNWQIYRGLELIPDSIPAAQPQSRIGMTLWRLRRSLANTLVRELTGSQQIKHLQRCAALDAPPASSTQISTWALAEPLGQAKLPIVQVFAPTAVEQSSSNTEFTGWSWYR